MIASTVTSLTPTSSRVSIIPGIDTGAPLRTETSSGRRRPPKHSRLSRSMWRMPSASASRSSPGAPPVASWKWLAKRVDRTKACGTGKPAAAMAARLLRLEAHLLDAAGLGDRVPAADEEQGTRRCGGCIHRFFS
jgi:hypothetical protein